MLVKMYLGGMSIRNLLCHKIAKSYGISNHGEFVHFVLTPSILKGE